ncbi:uncharacterized protein DFL_001877 [Arthrobotrys flagrans]|uniref:alpha-galactosidase n=2 Tax=Arthrobotrys flagrans TaxID=97331 RepID=A0A437A8W9_ARTFL|nr:hypothetical protein DFL_001877 [Arthrobotrys flagrans]
MAKDITITTSKGVVKKGSVVGTSGGPLAKLKRNRTCFWVLGALILLGLIGLGVGLGVGLTRGSNGDSSDNTADNSTDGGDKSDAASTSSSVSSGSGGVKTVTEAYKTRPSQTATAAHWQPTAGETWQITLIRPPNNTDEKVSAYDIDLFDNSFSFIASLKLKGYKVICYFSAGSYEDWRPDTKYFTKNDYGEAMDGWDGEWWLDTNSKNVRDIVSDRIALAQAKGCDAIDPDNINGYQNPTGFNLTEDDAVSFLEFMAGEAHGRGMAIGLKNGGAIVDDVVEYMDFCVQESCVAYNECGPYRAFLEYNSPVFHLEYPDESEMTAAEICSPKNGAQGFSTLIKHLILDDWTEYCP